MCVGAARSCAPAARTTLYQCSAQLPSSPNRLSYRPPLQASRARTPPIIESASSVPPNPGHTAAHLTGHPQLLLPWLSAKHGSSRVRRRRLAVSSRRRSAAPSRNTCVADKTHACMHPCARRPSHHRHRHHRRRGRVPRRRMRRVDLVTPRIRRTPPPRVSLAPRARSRPPT